MHHTTNQKLLRSIGAQLSALHPGEYLAIADAANWADAQALVADAKIQPGASVTLQKVGTSLTGISFDGVIVIRGEYAKCPAESDINYSRWLDCQVMPRIKPGTSFFQSYLIVAD